MFKRVLLCDDGSTAGRKALKRGAELAVLSNAEVFLLSLESEAVLSAAVWASAAGACSVVSPVAENERAMSESLRFLKQLGVEASGFRAQGKAIDEIAAYARKLAVDLVVVGHYPQPSGGRWWSGSERAALAERVNCCILIAVSE
jgi:nucleotide-binding universal stress UspA family protein